MGVFRPERAFPVARGRKPTRRVPPCRGVLVGSPNLQPVALGLGAYGLFGPPRPSAELLAVIPRDIQRRKTENEVNHFHPARIGYQAHRAQVEVLYSRRHVLRAAR